MKNNENIKQYHVQYQILTQIVYIQKKKPPHCEVALLFYELLRGEGDKCGFKE